MDTQYSVLFLFLIVLQVCTAPPVTQKKPDGESDKDNEVDGKAPTLEDSMEYYRYLKEVVDALESDPSFREKLEKAEEADIRSGKIAHELEYVNHKVRTKLDEIKRAELERLRHLASKKYDLENGLNLSHEKVGVDHSTQHKEHLDHSNPHTFEIEDLKKLIKKSTQDLAEADRKRRQDFKEYEMQKEFEKQEKLKAMDEEHRKQYETEIQQQEEKHKKHEPLHHPGSKQQLEEVWEKQDHMEQQDFDPKTFFMLHDLDGNGVWDENEVKALFIKELDKMYMEGLPEDDMRERIEEMERMREHVFGEVDQNKDGLISYAEFIDQTRKQEFNEDNGWKGLDQQKVYTEEEYRQFEKQRLAEVERLISQGMLPPHPGAPVYHDPRYQGQQQFPPQGYHHGQVPQGHHPGQVPPQGQYYPQQPHPGQVQPGQVHPGQVHPGQQYPPGQAQMHSGQVHPGPPHPQMQPGQTYSAQQGQVHMQPQYHPNQVPPQQHVPQPGQYNPGMSPQVQVHPQQLPNNRPPPPELDKNANVQLNTNEILPNNPPAVQGQKYQPPTQGQHPVQGQPVNAQPIAQGQLKSSGQVQQPPPMNQMKSAQEAIQPQAQQV